MVTVFGAHQDMLSQPGEEQILYKIMRVEDLINSICGNYLYFTRVDSYTDFHNADTEDGAQPSKDISTNSAAYFQAATNFTASDYYNKTRARTYACCFSIENTEHIWKVFGNGGQRGKVCIHFAWKSLKQFLSKLNLQNHPVSAFATETCVDFGLVEYKDKASFQANTSRLQNPIYYTFLKGTDNDYQKEKEFRIVISTLGIGNYKKGNAFIEFPPNYPLPFDWKYAQKFGAILAIEYAADCDIKYLFTEFTRLGIEPICPL